MDERMLVSKSAPLCLIRAEGGRKKKKNILKRKKNLLFVPNSQKR
jgi:hypothetical protein